MEKILHDTSSLIENYKLAIKLAVSLLKIGKPIPAVDIIIAAIALNNKLTLKTKDKIF